MNVTKNVEVMDTTLNKLLVICTLLLLLSLNLPSIVAVPALRIVYTNFGWFSITDIMLIIVSILLLFYYLFFSKPSGTFDRGMVILFFILTSILNLNGGRDRDLFFYFIRMFPMLFLGRLFVKNNQLKVVLSMIKGMSFLQILIILYSVFITPLGIERVGTSSLFWVQSNGINDLGRVMGTIGHPLVLAVFLLPGIITWFYDIVYKKKMTSLVGFALATYCIFLTFTRGTWLVLAITISFMILDSGIFKQLYLFLKGLHPSRKKIVIFSSIPIMIIAIFLTTPIIQAIVTRLSMTTMEDGSVFHRLEMFSWTVRHVTNNLDILFLGNGMGNTGSFLRNNPPSTYFFVIDNQYLTFLFEYGIFGFISIMSIFFLSIYRSYIVKERRIIFFILMALIMNAFTFELVNWYKVAIPLWLFIGLAIAPATMKETEP